jgi:hypothetical protein
VRSHLSRVFLLVLSIVTILLPSIAVASSRTGRSSVVWPSAPVSGPCVITSRGAPSAGCGLAYVYDKSGSCAAFSVGEHTAVISPEIQPDAGGQESTKLSTLPYDGPFLLREANAGVATKPGLGGAPELGGFKNPITEAEINSINRGFGGSSTLTGDVDTIFANASRYDTFAEKQASIIRDIAGRHLFDNGNKRTAQAVVEQLYSRNGISGPGSAAIRSVIDQVSQGTLRDVEAIAKALGG